MKESKFESNRRFQFWQKWMSVYSAAGILFGFIMVFGSTGIFFENYNQSISQAFWGGYDLHEAVSNYHPWIFSVLGASIAGWSVCLLFLSLYPFKRKEQWAYICFVVSVLVWALIDSAFSIYFRIYFEAIFNFIAVLGYAIPLAATYRDFFNSKDKVI